MKSFFLFLVTASILFTLTSFKSLGSEYDIEAFYKGTEMPDGSKVVSDDGLKEAKLILTSLKATQGTYDVEVTRIAKDLYKIDGQNFYIQTRYCYEYATSEKVILTVDSDYGFTKGKISF